MRSHKSRTCHFAVALLLLVSLFPTPAITADAPNITVFNLPDGSRPHDVAPAPGGKVWYTAQRHGALGILDPASGEIVHIPLGEGSAPHGVIQGPHGNAWITDSGLNAIVRFEPASSDVTVWTLPEDTGNANLNTAAFDGDDVLWFTGQNGIYGRLDPVSSRMDVYSAPTGRGPYGIAATPDGDIYFASLAGSYIAKIDRESGDAEVIQPVTDNQGARRVWSDSAGNIWVSEWKSGQLSRYDPASGRWDVWLLPGENPKAYAVYVDERDIVWVSDFGANAVLAFDPERETFIQAIPGSAPGANVRQILGREGEIWLPESGNDRLMRVRFTP
jgi:virginiamycin B lyase